MSYWLLKSEPDTFGIDDLAKAKARTTSWEGVRNYQARNMLRDQIKTGDLAFFYHSTCPEPGIAGIVEVASDGYPDSSAWRPGSPYLDAKSPQNKPLWYTVDVRLKQRVEPLLSLAKLREHADGKLADMLLLRRGNRLSVTPVSSAQWRFILSLIK